MTHRAAPWQASAPVVASMAAPAARTVRWGAGYLAVPVIWEVFRTILVQNILKMKYCTDHTFLSSIVLKSNQWIGRIMWSGVVSKIEIFESGCCNNQLKPTSKQHETTFSRPQILETDDVTSCTRPPATVGVKPRFVALKKSVFCFQG